MAEMMGIKATPEGTKSYISSFGHHQDKIKSFSSLSISSLGFGTYLGDCDEKTDDLYLKAIIKGIKSGINFIDTSINYRAQRSEKVVGAAIAAVAKEGFSRDQIVISTKGGIISCEKSLENFSEYVKKNYIQSGIISSNDIIANAHCISIPFLEVEIEKSLKNLNIDCIDLYYLHNPEVLLFSIPEQEFYRRLEEVFTLFEKKVEEGKIGSYGLATWNGFRQKSGSKGLLDLDKILTIATKVGGENHHFKAVQVPYNLVMLEMIKVPNQHQGDKKETFLTFAQENKIEVITSAPLMQSHILSLPKRIFELMPGDLSHTQKALQFVLSTPGVCCTLLGMKKVEHVEENLKILSEANWDLEEIKLAKKILGI